MIRADQIPDEAWKVTGLPELAARAVIAAAINAWPDVEVRPTFNPSRIILPLPQEKQND